MKVILSVLGLLWLAIFWNDLIAGKEVDLQPSAILLYPLRSPVPLEIVQEINFYRASKGLPPLEPDPRLNQAAMSRAEDMAEKRYFAHNCPHAGFGPEEAALKVGYSYSALAENIAKGCRMNSSEMVDGWIKSKGHRENMLNSRVKEIGVGVARGKWLDSLGFITVYYGVQLFGAPEHISQQWRPMGLNDQLQQEKPWAVLAWTRKHWKRSRMWKRAGVSEEKMARLVLSMDQETVQLLKDHAAAEVLVGNIFGESCSE